MRQFYKLLQEDDRKLYATIEKGHEFDFWEEDIYKLPLEYPYKLKMVNGELKDYTGSRIRPIFSKKLRDIINEFVGEDEIEWIHLKVESKDGSSLDDAYVPRFKPVPHMFDVLNEELTILTSDGDIMVDRLSAEKTKDKHFIRLLENTLKNYVSQDLKKAMVKAKVTGVTYKKEKMYP
ncbi:imm11 family protein [Campylobacter blaseri]|nr:DUF1629 domain-containing protein [Campylobacter blaseri]